MVMSATVAFGMGIDKPDVRFVATPTLPANPSRPITRRSAAPAATALPADTLTLYGLGDMRLRRLQIEEGEASDEQKRVERQRLNALVALCEGAALPPPDACSPISARRASRAAIAISACDGARSFDGTIEAQKALSAIVRTGERFGTEHLVSILIGENSEAVEKFGHDRLPTFGVGKEYDRREWRSIFRQLHGAGIVALDITGYGTWTVTDAGRRVLKGAERITLRKDTLKPAAQGGADGDQRAALADGGRRRHGAVRGAAAATLRTGQGAARRRLCRVRRQDAHRHGAAQAEDRRRDG